VLILRLLLLVVIVTASLLTALLDYGHTDRRTIVFRRRRAALICVTLAVLVLGLVSEIENDLNAKADAVRSAKMRQADAGEISRLRAEIHTEEVAHRRESEQAINSIDRLQQRLAELQAKITNDQLQSELRTYARELREARAILTPGPRAHLSAAFEDTNDPANELISTTLHPVAEVVRFKMWAKNASKADANVGSVWFRICEDCEVVEPPGGLQRVPEAMSGEYTTPVLHLGAGERVGPYSFVLRVSSKYRRIGIGFRYSCQTCDIPKGWAMLIADVDTELPVFQSGRRKKRNP
jgi:hypothetical protein